MLEPIWLHPDDGTIIDGRNRHRACCALGIQPTFRTWNGKGGLVAFVVSLNLRRRHLTSSQKAVVAVDILPLLEKEAAERRILTQGRPRNTEKLPQIFGEVFEEGDSGQDQDDADADIEQEEDYPIHCPLHPSHLLELGKPGEGEGKTCLVHICHPCASKKQRPLSSGMRMRRLSRQRPSSGTNRQYVADAKKIVEQAPEIVDKVRRGELSITQAKREVVKLTAPEPPPLPSGKFRVIYADPPWKYSNTQPDYQTEQGALKFAQTISEMNKKALGVKLFINLEKVYRISGGGP